MPSKCESSRSRNSGWVRRAEPSYSIYPGAVEQGPADANAFSGTKVYNYASYQIYALDGASATSVPQVGGKVVFAEFDVAEPLLLSPFVFGSGYGKPGFYGIQSMTFQMVISGNASRAGQCATFFQANEATLK